MVLRLVRVEMSYQLVFCGKTCVLWKCHVAGRVVDIYTSSHLGFIISDFRRYSGGPGSKKLRLDIKYNTT